MTTLSFPTLTWPGLAPCAPNSIWGLKINFTKLCMLLWVSWRTVTEPDDAELQCVTHLGSAEVFGRAPDHLASAVLSPLSVQDLPSDRIAIDDEAMHAQAFYTNAAKCATAQPCL